MSPVWFKRRPLIALQVEVTSRCTRECAPGGAKTEELIAAVLGIEQLRDVRELGRLLSP